MMSSSLICLPALAEAGPITLHNHHTHYPLSHTHTYNKTIFLLIWTPDSVI